MLHVNNLSRSKTLVDKGRVADNPWSRFRGLMGVRQLEQGDGLLIDPCDNIHTHFMRIPIDVLYVDANHCIVHIDPDMKPWRIGRRRAAARFVIEMPSGVVKSTKTIVGDQLQITVT